MIYSYSPYALLKIIDSIQILKLSPHRHFYVVLKFTFHCSNCPCASQKIACLV